MVEDGGIKLFFGGEVAKDHRFRDARSLRDFLGGRTAKTFVGKKIHCYPQDLRASLVAGHSRPGKAVQTSFNVLISLVKEVFSLVADCKVSTYLPPQAATCQPGI